MDTSALEQVRAFWPDAIESLQDVVPDGCVPLRLADEWREVPEQPNDLRIRTLDLLPLDPDGELEELVEDAKHLASGDGWASADEDEERGLEIFEGSDATLAIGAPEVPIADYTTSVLRIVLEQPWPSDVHPPVDLSEMFIDACRRALRLHIFPCAVSKIVVLDLMGFSRLQRLTETVRYNTDADLIGSVRRAGYEAQDDSWKIWTQTETVSGFETRARVTLSAGQVELTLEKSKIEGATRN